MTLRERARKRLQKTRPKRCVIGILLISVVNQTDAAFAGTGRFRREKKESFKFNTFRIIFVHAASDRRGEQRGHCGGTRIRPLISR